MNRYERFSEIRRGWSAPRELSAAPPRPVRLSGGGIALALLVPVLVAGAIAVVVGLGRQSIRQAAEQKLLLEQGQEASAVVTRLWRRGENRRDHYIEYVFHFDGRVYRRETRIGSAIWVTLREGSPLPVQFVPSNPGLNRARDLPVRKPASMLLAIFLAACLIAPSLLIVFALRRQIDLLTEGRPAPATVTKVAKVNTGHGNHTVTEYEFPLMNGSIAKGKSGPAPKGAAPGSILCVVYDKDNPRRNAPYPMGLVRTSKGAT